MSTTRQRLGLQLERRLPVLIRGFLLLMIAAFPCRAEKFLSGQEAARLAFPHATAFRYEVLTIVPEQKNRIERSAGSRGVPKQQKLWIAQHGTNILGVTVLDQVIGKHEYIDYAVALNTNGAVLQVEILEYREHYGQQVRDAKWRAQFRGKTAQSPQTFRKDVYNITGATLSCRHITEGVKRVLATYEVVVRPYLSGAGR